MRLTRSRQRSSGHSAVAVLTLGPAGRAGPGHGRPGPAAGFEFPGKAFDVGAADGEQGHGMGAAPGGELAQVQGVGLAGQPAVPGQETGEGEPFGVGEGGLDGNKGSGWGSSGRRAPPGRAGIREAGPATGPSN